MSASGQVDLWWADLDAPRRADAHPDDWREATRIVDRPAQRRLLARRSILREVLSHYLDCGSGELVVSRASSGRPELKWPRSDLRFSVSSSGATALFAITYGQTIGVDVERSCCSAGLTGAERLFLTAAERRMVSAMETQSRAIALLQFWTLKEALTKAMGTGLRTDPTELEIRFDTGPAPGVVVSPGGSPWRACLIPTSPNVVVAVAGQGEWARFEQHRYGARTTS